jgi:hydroxyacylglutathione hydrolase
MDLIPLKLSVSTCYLAKAGKQYVLFDTGYKKDADIFRKRLREAGITPAQISHLLLTHHHDDHCGLLHDVLAENGAVRVVMSAACRDLITAGENDRTHGGGYLNRRVAFLPGLFKRILRKQDADGAASFAFPPCFARENDNSSKGTCGCPTSASRWTAPS